MEIELSRVIDALPGLVWTALPDGQADFLNRRWLDYTGLTTDAALGSGWLAVVHPDDVAGLIDYWRGRLASGEGGETEARLRRVDGSYRWFHFRTSPVTDGAGRIVKWCGINTDIEDRKRAEAEVRAHERRFRSIVEGLPAIVTLMTPDGDFAYGNQHMIDYLGAPFDDLKTRPTTQSFHPDDRAEVDRLWRHSVETGEPYDHEARLKGGDGVYRWFHTRGFPLREPDGSIALWYLLQENIDDRRRADDEMRASERNARAIVDGFPGLVAVFSSDGFPEQVNQQMLTFWGKNWDQLKDWAAADLFHPEDVPRLLEAFLKAFKAKSAFEIEVRGRRFDGVYRWLLSRGIPVKDVNGRIVRWYNLLIDIDERKRAEDVLAASERSLKLIIDTTPAIMWSSTPDGDTESVNQHFLDYVGVTWEQLKGQTWALAIHPDDQDALAAVWNELRATGQAGETEARLRRHDGQYRWFLLRANPLRDENGNIVKWYGVNTDIEDRKRAEEAVAASERNLKLIIDTTPALIFTALPSGETESVNRHFVAYSGLPSDHLQGEGRAIVIHPDDQKVLAKLWRTLLTSGEAGEAEARLRRHDGEFRWFLLRANALRDDNGNIVKWYGVCTDIEDRKRADEALKAREREQARIIDTTPALIWTTDTKGRIDSVNKHYVDYVGLPLEQMPGQGWEIIHPDDLERLSEMWKAVIAAGSTGQTEARLRRHDGVYRWFLFRASPMLDETGKIIRWYGVNTDIEDRKRAEAALRASERNLQLSIDATPAMIWTTDAEGKTLSVNQNYLDYVGLPQNQLLGWGWTVAIHPDDQPGLTLEWQAILVSGKPGVAEARLRRHDGAYRWFLFRANPIRDESGKLVNWYGVNTDIEDRKRTEQDLRRSEASLAQGEAVSETGNFLWRLASNEITWSQQLYRTFGFELGSVVTLERIASVVHPEDRPMMEDMVARAQAGEDSEYEHRLLFPDGTIKYMHFVARATRDRQGAVEYIGVVQNVTERKLAEQALSKVRSELAHVSRVSTLGALTASIAHEVNQPLAGIVTNASTCLRMLGADPPNVDGARETARRTIRDGNRAAEVITRLRALFGKKEASFDLLDLNDAAREVVALSLNELQRNRVVLRQEFDEDLPSIAGDRVQLQQVILNLILNATDAMSDVNDRVRHLTIKTERDEDEQVRLSVQDTGAGFDSLTSAKMFDAFYTTKAGGMGIGLSVSRSIIDRHQGRLWATSNDGPGATFSFSIPCGSEARTDAAAFRASAATDAARGTSPN